MVVHTIIIDISYRNKKMSEELKKNNLVTYVGSTSEKDLVQPGLGKCTFP